MEKNLCLFFFFDGMKIEIPDVYIYFTHTIFQLKFSQQTLCKEKNVFFSDTFRNQHNVTTT